MSIVNGGLPPRSLISDQRWRALVTHRLSDARSKASTCRTLPHRRSDREKLLYMSGGSLVVIFFLTKWARTAGTRTHTALNML